MAKDYFAEEIEGSSGSRDYFAEEIEGKPRQAPAAELASRSLQQAPSLERKNVLGELVDVPGAASRAAMLKNPALSIGGPLAGLLAITGIGGKEAQSAAMGGALRPSSVPRFQDISLDQYYRRVGTGTLQGVGVS